MSSSRAPDGELYVFDQSYDRVAKERSMPLRSAKNLLLKLDEAKARALSRCLAAFDFDPRGAKS